jgi:NAD-dependent dihydropyrimidine dehydrogenase PreA subunit
MSTRKIIEIDQNQCDGCGQCAKACAEGAIQMIDGKARLVSDTYCDGLGACLGECPQGAIRIIEREAATFDEEAAMEHVRRLQVQQNPKPALAVHAGCPGSRTRTFPIQFTPGRPTARNTSTEKACGEEQPTALAQWPVQLCLVPPTAPFLQDADLLLVADCVPFAMPDFHRQLLCGRPLVIGCPKLDDAQFYTQKLADILTQSSVRSLTVVHMEVPCCTGLVRIAEAALAISGAAIPLAEATVSIRGKLLTPTPLRSVGA